MPAPNGQNAADPECGPARDGGLEDGGAGRRESGSGLKEQLWSPTFILIIFLTFAGFMVNQGLNTGASVYLSYIGETAALAGVGAAVFSIAGGFARLFGGKTIDSKGRAKCIIVGMGMMVVFAAAPIISYTGVPFIALRIMQGIAFGLATTAVATAAADVLPFSRLNEGIGYSGLGQALATSIGPAFALTLVATEPHTNLFLGLSVFTVVGFAASFFLRYEKKPWILPKGSTYRKRWEEMKRANAESEAVLVKGADATANAAPDAAGTGRAAGTAHAADTRAAGAGTGESLTEELDAGSEQKGWRAFIELSAMPGALPILIFSPCMGFMIYFGGLFGDAMGLGNIGFFFTISAITMIAIRICSKAFMNTVPPLVIFSVAVIADLVTFGIIIALSIGAFGDYARTVFFATGVLYGIAGALAMPINQAMAVRNSSAERWGAANATYLIAADIGIGLSCILWGVLCDAFGFTFVLCCIIGFLIASWVAAFLLYPRKKRQRFVE